MGEAVETASTSARLQPSPASTSSRRCWPKPQPHSIWSATAPGRVRVAQRTSDGDDLPSLIHWKDLVSPAGFEPTAPRLGTLVLYPAELRRPAAFIPRPGHRSKHPSHPAAQATAARRTRCPASPHRRQHAHGQHHPGLYLTGLRNAHALETQADQLL